MERTNRMMPFFLFIMMPVILAGCWDEIEIEDRTFLNAVAIDLAEEENATFEMTEQTVVPSGLGTITVQGGGKAFRNISETGIGIFEITRRISRQESKLTNVEHLGLILVSSELAEGEGMLANVLDVFIRQQYMRRGILVAIADEKAKELLNIHPEDIKVPAHYITDLLENEQSAVTKEPVRTGDIQEFLLVDRSYTVPLLSGLSDQSIDYEGIAVIAAKPSKMIGVLKGEDAKGRHFIIGRGQEGTITTKIEGELTTFEIVEGKSKYKLLNRDKNNLAFQVDIDVTASVKENFGKLNFFKEGNLKKFEKALEDSIKKLSNDSVAKIKDEFRIDVLELDKYLRTYHNKLWEEVKDNWDYGDNLFSQSEVTVNVKVIVRDPGSSIRVK